MTLLLIVCIELFSSSPLQRERSRWKFVPSNYCSISAVLDCVPAASVAGVSRSKGKSSAASDTLLAKLCSVNTRRVANERDFDSVTGELRKASTAATTAATKLPASASMQSGKVDPVIGPTASSASDKERLVVLDESLAQQLMAWLSGDANGSTGSGTVKSLLPAPVFKVTYVDTRKTSRKPPPPFITSSLQQESSRKHGFSPSRTMAVAQSLYEKGHITYMRTDSPTLSSTAVTASQKMVAKLFGNDYLPSAPQDSPEAGKKASKAAKDTAPKNAQEAHEAIRPAEVGGRFALPEDLHALSQEEKTLYGLILRRTLASVMKPSQSATCTYTITAAPAAGSKAPSAEGEFTEAVFRSSDTRVTFPGFLLAVDMFGKKEPLKSSSAQQEQGSIQTGQLMKLSDRKDVADLLRRSNETADGEVGAAEMMDAADVAAAVVEQTVYQGLSSARHTTRPPTRFTEASFIQEMEELGVGRPSTYSAILHTLKEREYITVEKQTIIPTIKGMVVCEFLEKHFPQFVDAHFTAEMEQNLDLIARGECDKVEFLNRFYLQEVPEAVASHETAGSRVAILKKGLLPTITQKLRSEEINHAESRRLHVPFLQDVGVLTYSSDGASFETFVPATAHVNATASGAVVTKSPDRELTGLKWALPESMQQDIRGVTSEAVRLLLELQIPKSGSFLGLLPNTQLKIYQKSGRYGRYLQVGDKPDVKFYSVPAWMNSVQQNLTLSDGLDLIALPKVLGTHPELNKEIIVEMNRNVIGVGVVGTAQRVPVADGLLVKDVTLGMALQLLPPAQEISTAGGSLGIWRDNPVLLVYGKFGPYIRSGNIVGGVKGDLAKSPARITFAQAVEILETRGKELGAKSGVASNKLAKNSVAVQKASAKVSKAGGVGEVREVSKKNTAVRDETAIDSASMTKRSTKATAAAIPSSVDGVDGSEAVASKPKRQQKSKTKSEGEVEGVAVGADTEAPKTVSMRKSRVMKVKDAV